jgi:hypothetical protein
MPSDFNSSSSENWTTTFTFEYQNWIGNVTDYTRVGYLNVKAASSSLDNGAMVI